MKLKDNLKVNRKQRTSEMVFCQVQTMWICGSHKSRSSWKCVFVVAVSSVSPKAPAPPEKFPHSLSSAGTERKEKKKKTASSALNQNNYPKKCRACERRGRRSTEAVGSHLLQSLLVISPPFGGSRELLTGRRCNGRMRLRSLETRRLLKG